MPVLLALPLLAAFVCLGDEAAAQQFGGTDLTSQVSTGLRSSGQLTDGLGSFTYTGQAAPSLTGRGYQLPAYDLPGVSSSRSTGGLDSLASSSRSTGGFDSLASSSRSTGGFDSLAAPPARIGTSVGSSLPVADRFETGYASMPEVDELIRKMSLGSTGGSGASWPDLTSTQATPQASNKAAWQPQWQAADLQVPPWETPSRLSAIQTPTMQLPSSSARTSQLEDSASLLHLRGGGFADQAWRPLPPLPNAVVPSPVQAQPLSPINPPVQSPVMQVEPLTPLEVRRSAVLDRIVQVDELLCNPPCATGHGFCARDTGSKDGTASAGVPRCFCKSPYAGPTCGTDGESVGSLWNSQVALLAHIQELIPNPLGRSAWLQVGTLALAGVTLAVLLTMLCRCALPARERGNKCFSPTELYRAVLRRGENTAERAPLLRALPRGPMRAPELEPQRARSGLVESWVKSQSRRPGSTGRRRPGLDTVPQVFKDESDEEN